MTVTHATRSMKGIGALPRGAVRDTGANATLAVAAALFIAVLIIETVIIITGAPRAADLSALYLFTT